MQERKRGADARVAQVKDRELRIALLNRGVFAVHGGGALSEAHADAEVEAILEAYEGAAADLKRELVSAR